MKNLLYFFIVLVFSASCNESPKKSGNNTGTAKNTVALCSSPTTDKAWYSAGTKAPKMRGLEGIDFKISTSNKEAQAYFNQGLMLAYGFNHAEAARSFFEATRLDPNCAMAYWGFAYVLGPNYNAGMEDDNYQRAYQASQKALSLAGNCTEKEKALIQALIYRYTPEPPQDRSHLDSAYSSAMKRVYSAYSTDADISALYAESLMNMHPWDMYDKKTKEPRPWTPEIVAVLEKLIKQYPKHPGAPHFYIHAVEASKTPERGLASAKLLMSLVPGSGHLVHMPSHIYIWTGDYHLGSLANLRAVEADSSYITACHAQGAYPLAYYPHNYHYLSATATLEGNSALAWQAAKKVQENTAQDIMTQPGWGTLQHYYTIPYYVAVKFGMWDRILSIEKPKNDLIYPQAILHYARGMAYLGKNNIAKAENELSQLKSLSRNSALKELTIWDINSMYDLVQIAVNVLSAEIYHKQKQYDKSIALFHKAIAIEDNLNYNEPPDWFFSVWHSLGAVLLEAGKYADAEKVYLEDLNTYAENGWALAGLYQALQQQGKQNQAKDVKKRFDEAWQYADIKISSSSGL
ncbi:MAG TPA: tetratricopeptide repeat protein [Daejeonella sp.]|nr:tetratricopeptide repeat protein [Daejeonella sp.]